MTPESGPLAARTPHNDEPSIQGIDPRIPRFSQAVTGSLLLLAFILVPLWAAAALAVPVLAVTLALPALFGPRFNPWGLLFRHLLKPLLRLGPPAHRKDPAPSRFAMLLGFLFLAAASFLLFAVPGPIALWAGWAFVLVVAALALLAAVTQICVGCEIYTFIARRRTRDLRFP